MLGIRQFTNWSRSLKNPENTSVLSSLLYGVKPRTSEEPSLATSHSKTLARGKYVHELCFHNVKPKCMDAYLKLVNEHYPRVAAKHNVNLVGSWRTAVGADLDQYVHMWEYKGYKGHQMTLESLSQDEKHADFERKLRPMLRQRSNQMCLEFAFWATSPPAERNGIYELRTYTLKPGHLLEWENHWQKGLEIRKRYCEPVGAWFSQFGQLSVVHHMWFYPDLETRKKMREAAWQVDGWAETVYNTVPLVQSMQSRILEPLKCSPLK